MLVPQSAGAPFYVYAITPYRSEILQCRNYAVTAGDSLQDSWDIGAFADNKYHLRAYGPNGFYREFKGDSNTPAINARITYEQKGTSLTGNLALTVHNRSNKAQQIKVIDNSYGQKAQSITLPAGKQKEITLDLGSSHGWYDFSVNINGTPGFEERFAGRVETGRESQSDPLIGRIG